MKQMIYKRYGKTKLHNLMVDYKVVTSEEELQDCLNDGWAESPALAYEDKPIIEQPIEEQPKVEEPEVKEPVREEVIAKAKELGIEFKPQTRTNTLVELIEAKQNELD